MHLSTIRGPIWFPGGGLTAPWSGFHRMHIDSLGSPCHHHPWARCEVDVQKSPVLLVPHCTVGMVCRVDLVYHDKPMLLVGQPWYTCTLSRDLFDSLVMDWLLHCLASNYIHIYGEADGKPCLSTLLPAIPINVASGYWLTSHPLFCHQAAVLGGASFDVWGVDHLVIGDQVHM